MNDLKIEMPKGHEMEKMKFKKPIVFFDLETTGIDVTSDRIVQIGALKMSPDGTIEEKKTLVNPEMHIPEASTEVHGITDKDVKDAPKFSQIANSLSQWLSDCDLGGYNSNNYDIPLLIEEFSRFEIVFPENDDINFLDVLKLERHINSHKLEATYKRYTGKGFKAHDALEDIKATVEVLQEQMNIYGIEADAKKIDTMLQEDMKRVDYAGKIYEEGGKYLWSFGKNKGLEVKDDPSYCSWVLSGKFPKNTKDCITKILKGDM